MEHLNNVVLNIDSEQFPCRCWLKTKSCTHVSEHMEMFKTRPVNAFISISIWICKLLLSCLDFTYLHGRKLLKLRQLQRNSRAVLDAMQMLNNRLKAEVRKIVEYWCSNGSLRKLSFKCLKSFVGLKKAPMNVHIDLTVERLSQPDPLTMQLQRAGGKDYIFFCFPETLEKTCKLQIRPKPLINLFYDSFAISF